MIRGMFRGFYHRKKGLMVDSRIPVDLKIEPVIFTRLFSNHLRKNGFDNSKLSAEEENNIIISFFSGEPKFILTGLIVGKEGNWNHYLNIFNNITNLKLEQLSLENLIEDIIKSDRITREQELYFYLNHPLRKRIIKFMRENGIFNEQEFFLFFQKEGFSSEEIRIIINNLCKNEILLKTSFNNKNYLILIKDFLLYRSIPPKKMLIKANEFLPTQIIIEYLSEIKDFFKMYNNAFPNDIDSEVILKVITDPLLYKIILNLRENILSLGQIMQMINHREIMDKIESLKSSGFIKEIEYQDSRFFLIKSNPKIKEFFPMYILNNILDTLKNKSDIEKIKNQLVQIINSKKEFDNQ